MTAEFVPNPGIDTGAAILDLASVPDGVELRASGLQDAKAIFTVVNYDPQALHFTGGSPLADPQRNLQLLVDRPEEGRVYIGLVVIDADNAPGISGSQALAQLQFAAGPARVAAVAPTHSRNVINLTGSIDANNIPSLSWNEALYGDGDNNGEVNLADLLPLGKNLKKPFTPGNAADPVDSERSDVDYDSNTEINGADITVIGQNFKATIGGYRVRSGPTAGNYADLEQLPRAVEFPAPEPKGLLTWTWTGAAALTADTHFQVEPYDRDDNSLRGLPSANDVLLQPTTTVTYTDISIGFTGKDTWPANRIAPNGDYIVIVTENSVDGVDGNAEPFATESLQLVITGETDQNPGVPVDITSSAYMGLLEGGGLATVSLASATRGKLTFKDRGRITVQTFAPGDFTLADEISFQLMTIDSMGITSGSGASPVSVGSGTSIQFTITGTFDFDSDDANGNEITQDITDFCSWGVLPAAGNAGSFVVRSDNGSLLTATAQTGDSATIYAEFPNTDDVQLYDNQKRSTAPFIVNIN